MLQSRAPLEHDTCKVGRTYSGTHTHPSTESKAATAVRMHTVLRLTVAPCCLSCTATCIETRLHCHTYTNQVQLDSHTKQPSLKHADAPCCFIPTAHAAHHLVRVFAVPNLLLVRTQPSNLHHRASKEASTTPWRLGESTSMCHTHTLFNKSMPARGVCASAAQSTSGTQTRRLTATLCSHEQQNVRNFKVQLQHQKPPCLTNPLSQRILPTGYNPSTARAAPRARLLRCRRRCGWCCRLPCCQSPRCAS